MVPFGLCFALLLLAPTACAAAVPSAAVPVVTRVVPSEGSLLGGTELRISADGLGQPQASARAYCQFNWSWAGWAFNATTAPFAPAFAPSKAVVHANGTLTCKTPAVVPRKAGYVSVRVSVDSGKSWSGSGGNGVHDQPLFRFFAPFSAAVSRRPFVAEVDIGLLLNIHPSLAAQAPLTVSAVLGPDTLLPPTAVGVGVSSNVSFAAAKLPLRVDGPPSQSRCWHSLDPIGHPCMLQVTLHGSGGAVIGTESVRLLRAAISTGSTYQPTVAIDYTTRGLLAEGMPLLGMGYFTSGYDVTSHREVATTIKELQRTAAEGFTMVQIYRLGSGPIPQILAVLNAAAAVGIYVHMDVCELVSNVVGHHPDRPAANSTAIWTQLRTVVEAMRGHPGLLAWYISDDTVNWPHDALRAVYDQIKSWDPHHPVSAAMAWAGNALNYRDCFDINMFENYPFTKGGTASAPDVPDTDFWTGLSRQYPICGQGGSFAPETAAQLRAQNYLGFAAGLTGNLIFIHHGGPVGLSPFQLQAEAAVVNAELQELLPAILAPKAGPAHDPTAGPLATVSPGCWPGTVDPSVPQPVPQDPSSTWLQGGEMPCAVATAFREPNGCTTILLASKSSRPLPVLLKLPAAYAGATLSAVFQHDLYNLSAAAGLATTLGPLGAMALQHHCEPTAPPPPPPKKADLVANGGMEQWNYPGRVSGWQPSTTDLAGPDGLDLRTAAFADTRFPHSGRHSLRAVSPDAATTVWPIALAGGMMMANTSYDVSLWVRTLSSNAGKALSVAALDKEAAVGSGQYSSTAVPAQVLARARFKAGAWQRVSCTVTGVNGSLALLTDEPMVFWLDDVSVLVAA